MTDKEWFDFHRKVYTRVCNQNLVVAMLVWELYDKIQEHPDWEASNFIEDIEEIIKKLYEDK